jgi:hypothetical protein
MSAQSDISGLDTLLDVDLDSNILEMEITNVPFSGCIGDHMPRT